MLAEKKMKTLHATNLIWVSGNQLTLISKKHNLSTRDASSLQ